jgi:methyl-accepting chemotaxis protein
MIDESTRRAQNGVEIAGRVGAALDEIAAGTKRVNTLLAEISSASQEQSSGISQINTGVTELDKVTQSNAGSSEELASSAEETAAQVASLRSLVGQFKVTRRTSTQAAAPRRPAAKPLAASGAFAPQGPAKSRGKKAASAPRQHAVAATVGADGGEMDFAEQAIPMSDKDTFGSF